MLPIIYRSMSSIRTILVPNLSLAIVPSVQFVRQKVLFELVRIEQIAL